MTAPDHIAKIFQKTLARGGRPHMIFANYAGFSKNEFVEGVAHDLAEKL